MNRLKSVNLVFLTTVLISIVGSLLNTWIINYTDNYFIVLLLSQIILVIPTIAYLVINKLNVAKAIRFNKIRLSNVVLIILFAYLITPLMNFINAISMLFVSNDTTDFISNIVSNNGLFLSLFMVALVPCILEETVYRGIFYNEYSKISPFKGIVLSGFLFGIIHGNLNQFSYAFAMGIVFALLIEATNSILATMIVHFFINGTSILLLAMLPKMLALLEAVYGTERFNANELMESVNGSMVENMDLAFVIQNYGIMAVLGTILAFIVYRTIAKNSGRWEYVKGIFRKKDSVEASLQVSYNTASSMGIESESLELVDKNKRLITWSLAFAILICIGLMVVSEYDARQAVKQGIDDLSTLIVWMRN